MKRIFTWIALGLTLVLAASCYDDSALKLRLDSQDTDIKNLKSDVNNLKDAVKALQDAESGGWHILNVEDVKEGGKVIGWTIHFDNGKSITIIPGSSSEGGSTVTVTETADGWVFVVDGKSYTIPKSVAFAIEFKENAPGAVVGKVVLIPYTLRGVSALDNVSVETLSSSYLAANVVEGAIAVYAYEGFTSGKIIVIAANGRGNADMKALNITPSSVEVVNSTQETPASKDGGKVEVTVTTNLDFNVVIPEEAQSWLSFVGTKSWTETLEFTLQANHGVQRSATVSLQNGTAIIQTFEIVQAAGAEYSAKVAVSGTADAVKVVLSGVTGDAAYIKATVAASVEEGSSAILAGGDGVVTVAKGDGEVVSDAIVPAVTGLVKLVYKVYSSANQVIDTQSIPVYAVAPADAVFAGTYKFNPLYCLAIFDRSAWRDMADHADNIMTFEVSDDPAKGSVMITDFFGLRCDGANTNTSLTNANGDSPFTEYNASYLDANLFGAGAPVYGWLDKDFGYLRFDNTVEQTFLTYNEEAYMIRNGHSNQTGFIFEVNLDASPVTVTYGSSLSIAIVREGASPNGKGQYAADCSLIMPSNAASADGGAIFGTKQ